MTWVKIDDNAPDDPRALRLPRGVRLLHFEALAWASRHATGGAIPPGQLARLTDEEAPEMAVAMLVAAGLWDVTDQGWQLVWLQDDQPSPELVARWRERNRLKQDRHRRHVTGDHALCSARYCKATSNPVTNGGSNPTPSRPVRPVQQDRDGKDGDAAGLGTAAAVPSKEPTGSADTVTCSAYQSHSFHHQFLGGRWRCDVCDRRAAADEIRKLPDDLKPRALKAFHRAWGHLYQSVPA
jgi:hypothetical protein